MTKKHVNFNKHQKHVPASACCILILTCVAVIVLATKFVGLLLNSSVNVVAETTVPESTEITIENDIPAYSATSGCILQNEMGTQPTETEALKSEPEVEIIVEQETLAETEAIIAGADPVNITEEKYDNNDLEILAKVMCYEAGGQREEILLMVGAVIKNRVESDLFPDTYYSVVTQPWQYGKLHEYGPFWPAWTDNDPSYRDYCRELAKRVITGDYKCPDNVIFQAGFVQGSGIYKEIDGYYFCYE